MMRLFRLLALVAALVAGLSPSIALAQQGTPTLGIDKTGTSRNLSVLDLTNSAFVPMGALDTSVHVWKPAVPNNYLTNAFLATMPAQTVKGNATTGAATPSDLTVAQLKALVGGLSISVTDPAYGAKCDGATDDTAAFQAALNAVLAAGGGTMTIPASSGGCVVGSSPMTYSGNNLRIAGYGSGSLLKKSGTTGDMFQFTGASATNIWLDNFIINAGNGVTTGTLLSFTGTGTTAGNFFLSHLSTYGGWNIIYFGGGQDTFLSDSSFNFFVNNGLRYGVAHQGESFATNILFQVTPSGAGVNNANCVLIENGDTFLWSNIQALSCNTDYAIFPPAGNFVKNVYWSNVQATGDNRVSANGGFYINGGNGGGAYVTRFFCTECSTYSIKTDSFIVATVSEFHCTNCYAINPDGHGIHIQGTNTGIYILGGTFEGASHSASGTKSGISIDVNSTGVSIIGVRSGLSSPVDAGNTQKYGIEFTGTVTNALVRDNILTGNLTAGLLAPGGASTGTCINENIGYNPVGSVAATNVPASPGTVTAGFSDEDWYFKQTATNTATITQGGQQIATLAGATTYYPVHVKCNESAIVTWVTTNPTVTRVVH